MRIVKTTSAGISPRSSVVINRRKTLMSGSPHRRRPPMYDHNCLAVEAPNSPYDMTQLPSLANRPVSWHASSQLAPQASHPSHAYPLSGYGFNSTFNTHEQLSTQAVYSGYTTPASTFSPLSQPFTDYRQSSYQFTEDSFFPNNLDTTCNGYPPYHTSIAAEQADSHCFSSSDNMDPTMYSHFDWDNFATNGFDAASAPPTPEYFLPIQQPDPTFEAEESIPYQPLEDDEPGEVLVGMGLYDTPEKVPDSDPHLDNYRALMMSQLLGTPYKKIEPPVSTGKGLKLEETWNPPTSDDEEDGEEEEDSEEDAEGSVAEEDSEEALRLPAEDSDTVVGNSQRLMETGNGLEFGRSGWL
jgi:hypothetical protein